jgi:Iron-containing redox enzyme
VNVARLPRARGPLSAAIVKALRGSPTRRWSAPAPDPDADVLADDDLQLALRIAYDLHYTAFSGVDPAWEWDPDLIGFRTRLEHACLEALRDRVGSPGALQRLDAAAELQQLANGDGPSLSQYLRGEGSWEELREFVAHRSAYQRKEADPHTWAIPRLRGRAKAAMVAIQHDEYGGGVVDDLHAELFAVTMQAFGLDPTYGAYVDRLPGVTLATDNLPTLFGLHRELAPACVGHLALFEMTSVGPMGRYSATLARHGIAAGARRFYDVHVEADAIHERVALEDMVRGLLDDDPTLAGAVVFGARALTEVEGRFTDHLLGSWEHGRSSLLLPLDPDSARSSTSPTPVPG